jgi:endonuclease-3 related protein
LASTDSETADSILLYALERPSFVVDAYTARLARRHRLIDET